MKKEPVIVAVRRFFADNPGEELTFADMETKFGVKGRALRDLVCRLKAQRSVDVVHVVKGLRYAQRNEQ